NDAPDSGVTTTTTALENQSYAIKLTDIPFSDSHDTGTNKGPQNALAAIIIQARPATGTGSLSYRGNPATVGTVVTADEIVAGLLTYRAPTDKNGANFANITFKVQDTGGAALVQAS